MIGLKTASTFKRFKVKLFFFIALFNFLLLELWVLPILGPPLTPPMPLRAEPVRVG